MGRLNYDMRRYRPHIVAVEPPGRITNKGDCSSPGSPAVDRRGILHLPAAYDLAAEWICGAGLPVTRDAYPGGSSGPGPLLLYRRFYLRPGRSSATLGHTHEAKIKLICGDEMKKVDGNWTGRITGTNNANVFAEIKQDGSKLYGIGRINDPQYGTSVYNFTGVIEGNIVTLSMVPDEKFVNKQETQEVIINGRKMTITANMVRHGNVSVKANLVNSSTIEAVSYTHLTLPTN